MKNYPFISTDKELSKKQFWIAAYLSCLSRLSPKDAEKEANEALDICDKKWKSPEIVGSWNFKHNYPLGHEFPEN